MVSARPSAMATPIRRRMRSDDRGQQLLDVAATIIVADGAAAVSMERLAIEAEVSKALPYKHFENAEAVLTALYRRETAALGRHVWRALRDAPSGSDLLRVGLATYFDEIVARASVAVDVVGPDRLELAPDCGMWFLPRDTCFGKLQAMEGAARILRTTHS